MVEIVNTQVETLKFWMKSGGYLTSNRKGLLWKYSESTSITQMSKSQKIKGLEDYSRILQENRSLKQEDAFLIESNTSDARIVKSSPFHVHSILFRYRHENFLRDTIKQVLKNEKIVKKAEGNCEDGNGEIYAAWNPLMVNLQKLGFTSTDAETRVKALQTAGVLEPFQLARHACVPDAG